MDDINNLFNQLQIKMSKTIDEHQQKVTQLEEERKRFEEDKARMQGVQQFLEERVKLIVGGVVYSTTISTLRSEPGTFLDVMFSGNFKMTPDESGYYFLDRNGKLFGYILDYLRNRELICKRDPVFLAQLRKELEYFQIHSLLTPRRIDFVHEYDYDGNGLIYYISTRGKTQPWTNAYTANLIQISCSSLNTGTLASMVNNYPSSFYTSNIINSWVQIDFGDKYKIRPTHYTLSCDAAYTSNHVLRSWKIEGKISAIASNNNNKKGKEHNTSISNADETEQDLPTPNSTEQNHAIDNNGQNANTNSSGSSSQYNVGDWILLRQHTNDTTLGNPRISTTFSVTCPEDVYCSSFRITITGFESTDKSYFLMCSAFEIYGNGLVDPLL